MSRTKTNTFASPTRPFVHACENYWGFAVLTLLLSKNTKILRGKIQKFISFLIFAIFYAKNRIFNPEKGVTNDECAAGAAMKKVKSPLCGLKFAGDTNSDECAAGTVMKNEERRMKNDDGKAAD